MRRRLAGLLVVPLLVGCSSSDEPSAPEPAAEDGSAVPTWNPCADLEPEEVTELLGEEVTEEGGTPGAQRCTYVPVAEGGPTLDLNYLWFDGSFEEAWDSVGDVAGEVRDLDIGTADDARMVVQVTDDAVLVTGFVQTGGLIESVNAIALDPAARDRVVRATRGVLALLSERAPARAEG